MASAEQTNLLHQRLRRGDYGFRCVDSSIGFLDRAEVTWALGVLQLVASTAQRAELSKARTELGPGRTLDGVVTTLRRRPQPLLREQTRECLASSVVRQNECRVRIGLNCRPRRRDRSRSPEEQRLAVRRSARERLQVA